MQQKNVLISDNAVPARQCVVIFSNTMCAAINTLPLRRASCPPPFGQTPLALAKIAPGDFVAA